VKYLLDLQVISLEGWTDIMYYVQDAHSFWDWIYFVLLIVVSVVVFFFSRGLWEIGDFGGLSGLAGHDG